MLLLLRFFTFFFKIQKVVTFYVFLPCLVRFPELCIHSFSRGCPPKSRNHAKFRQNLTLQQFKVIQGLRSCMVSIERPCIINLAVSATVFETLTLKVGKWLNFHTLPFLEAPSGGTPLDIDVIYTPLKSAFNGLQFRR